LAKRENTMPFNPYDQMLIDEGIRRGYQPHQIAAFLGNRRQESANNPIGAVGDSGTAYGGFQWRGDRQAALRALGDPTKPETQVAHFYAELEGPEAKAAQAIKAATSVDEANRAMKGFLRYGDNSLDTRLNYSNEAMKMLDPNYVPQQGNIQPAGQGQQPQDTSYQDSFLQGGPMALFGKGQQNYDWGNALIGLGSSLASINSPQQAAAIAGLKGDPGKDIVSQYDSQTGTWSHYNKRTGAYTQTKDPNWLKNMTDAYTAKKKIEADYKPPSDKEIERFGAHQEFLDKNNSLIEDLSGIKQYLDKNPNAAGWMDSFKTLGSAAVDGSGAFTPEFKQKLQDKGLYASPEQQDFFGRLERVQQKLIAQEQLRQKGVQTEGDALRYGKANFDTLSKLSGDALNNAITDRLKDAYKDQARVYGNFEGIAKRYQPGGDARFQPDATGIDKWRESAEISKSRLGDLEKSIQEKRAQQSQQPQQGQGGGQGNGGNRPDPASLAPSLFGGNRGPQAPAPAAPSAPPSAPPPNRVPAGAPRPVKLGEGENAVDVFLMPDGSAKTVTGVTIPKEQIESARRAGILK
jgi:hypothetical protein